MKKNEIIKQRIVHNVQVVAHGIGVHLYQEKNDDTEALVVIEKDNIPALIEHLKEIYNAD